MMSPQVEIQLIAAVTAAACSLVGTFLVLRRMAMMSDAISHSILLGIVVAFLAVGDLASPWLVLGAAVTGVLTVALVETLHRTRLVKEDAAIGLVFPALFSLGVILLARHAGAVHLDTDVVLLGELAFAPFDRFAPGGTDLGPRSLWMAGGVLLLDAAALALFFKELKLATFDAGLAATLGFAPALIHYGLMSLVSVTAVASFDAVGLVLVVALMVGPPAAAHLLTDRLPRLLGLAVLMGAASAVGGYWLARWLDVSIAGAMAATVGFVFLLALLLAPQRGLVAAARRRATQRLEFALAMLAIHVAQHECGPDAGDECRADRVHLHLHWEPDFSEAVLRAAEQRRLLRREDGLVRLDEAGRDLARGALTR